MVEPVVGIEGAKDPGPLHATARRAVHAPVKAFIEPVIQGETDEAGPEEGPAAGGLHPPEDWSMEAPQKGTWPFLFMLPLIAQEAGW